MSTHDQEAADYFKNTDVHSCLCLCNADSGKTVIQGFQVGIMFTHHQMMIVVDTEIPRGMSHKRMIGSSIAKDGPKEPWHDIHCRLEGPVAWDVLYNFGQRWRKHIGNRFIYSMNDLDKFIIRPTKVTTSGDRVTWNVQIFWSIDGGVVTDFHVNPEEASKAKNFIYIENQYLIGSCYGWKLANDIKLEDIRALHLIPKEISLKIVGKIQAGERFTVYIILHIWREDIFNALESKGNTTADPREYLTFFYLGNREVEKPGEYKPPQKPVPDTNYARDNDEYIIIGYVNINQRSMDGARDSEIAMGSY
ncbi:hypothetical protein MTR67_018914 [Solanum verrucosum]|uniref:Uncharacterized protein n=1 Tax=Solanum verrucosum TaxID=315347 RepID=A0AAF0QKJ0_SOLVR|nr:hypothetical protein MTR67_018914 [Solanum verrucosum]